MFAGEEKTLSDKKMSEPETTAVIALVSHQKRLRPREKELTMTMCGYVVVSE